MSQPYTLGPVTTATDDGNYTPPAKCTSILIINTGAADCTVNTVTLAVGGVKTYDAPTNGYLVGDIAYTATGSELTFETQVRA